MPGALPPTQLYASERVVVLLSCVLSFLGSSLLVCTHALWPELRTRPRQLLLYLSLADLLSALSYFYGVLQDFDRTSWDCVLQGALSTFSNTSSFFWTMAIAVYLYLTIVRGSPTGTGLLCCFHAVSIIWELTESELSPGGTEKDIKPKSESGGTSAPALPVLIGSWQQGLHGREPESKASCPQKEPPAGSLVGWLVGQPVQAGDFKSSLLGRASGENKTTTNNKTNQLCSVNHNVGLSNLTQAF